MRIYSRSKCSNFWTATFASFVIATCLSSNVQCFQSACTFKIGGLRNYIVGPSLLKNAKTSSALFSQVIDAPAQEKLDAVTKKIENIDVDSSIGGSTKRVDPLDVRIDGVWYDLSRWRKAHPAGSHWIDWYNGRDATEVMHAFHSAKGRDMVKRLPKVKAEDSTRLDVSIPATSTITMNFRKLRQELEDEGWFERDIGRELTLLSIYASLLVGAAIAPPPLACVLLGLSMTQAGWLGHDYVHGVDRWSFALRQLTTLAGGLGCTWWSDKHNKHHALTNEQGVDEDIATDPFLYTWAPDPANDSPLRKIQHLIFFIPFSALFALWRVDTISVIIEAVKQGRSGAKLEAGLLCLHYLILLSVFPLNVWIPAIFLSGLISAIIVTPTHQSEEFFDEYQHDWVSAQFRSTRNAVTTNAFSEWLWGGMQYQLEHHLFPSMPRSNYPLLKPILTKFAEENNIPGGYRESGEFEILKMNWDLYKRVAEAEPVVGAPYSRGNGQLGAIHLGFSPAARQSTTKVQ